MEELQPVETKRDVIGAVTVIFLGLVMTLNLVGMVPMSVWIFLWRCWPLLLVYKGLKMLIGESKAGEVLLTVLVILAYILISIWMVQKYDLTVNMFNQAMKGGK